MLSNSQNHQHNYSLLLHVRARQGPRTLETMLFDQPHLLTVPSTALCIHTGSIVHAHPKYR